MSITKMEQLLIEVLVDIGVNPEEEIFETVLTFMRTNKQRNQMIEALVDRYEKKGKVTEEEMLKMVIMITCEKKEKEIH